MVVLTVLPVMPPGLMVQLPAGRPFNTTLPVERKHVVWVITPINGAVGTAAIVTEVTADTSPQPPDAAIV
jgi:hypothetical protein